MNKGLSGSELAVPSRIAMHGPSYTASEFIRLAGARKLAGSICVMGILGLAQPLLAQEGIPNLSAPQEPSLPNLTAPSPSSDTASPSQQPIPDSPVPASGSAGDTTNSLTPLATPRYDRPLGADPSPGTAAFDGYHLGPGDSIFVSVQRFPDLSFQATLDLRGNVIVPIEGMVNLEGLTLTEAQELIRTKYNRYVEVENPGDVALTLVAQRGVEITILGAVQRPGFYPLTDPSVSTALLTAGGATRTSDLRAIQIQRRVRTGNGMAENTTSIDLFTPLKEGEPLPDLRLEDGDVVIVPELDPSELDEYDRFLVARSTLAQPIINVRFLNYAGGRAGVGTLNVNNGSTFMDAISLLGVNPDTANLGDVGLIRFDPETGRAVTVSLDAKAAIRGDITQNPPLEDSDVIVVGRNLIGRLSYALRTITQPFRDVFGFTNFVDNVINNDLFN